MAAVVIYCSFASPRLTYVLDWIFNEQLQTGYTLTNDKSVAAQYPFAISYGDVLQNGISIPATDLLQQSSIEAHTIARGTANNVPVLYAVNNSAYSFNFDLFAAVFFLITRYEEYLPYQADKHNRFPATQSILFGMDCLERPLVDEWLLMLRNKLNKHLTIPVREFSFLPTYDIDIAYSYTYKGLMHTIGGYLKDIVAGNKQRIKERTASLKGDKDPFDSFDWLFDLHVKYHIRPVYFILSAQSRSAFDKNIHPAHPAMKRLIKRLAADGDIGLHPSYYSNRDTDLIFSEKKLLVSIASSPVNISRQHYIKNKIPYTYKLLMAKTITEDYSMGYATHLGFRAGTGNSFLWYNLKEEKTTTFRVHPFCFMDTAARFECALNAVEAFARLEKMKIVLQKCGSRLITVFHNFSLGTDEGWKGWKESYEKIFDEIATS
jgi:hypothetical protein